MSVNDQSHWFPSGFISVAGPDAEIEKNELLTPEPLCPLAYKNDRYIIHTYMYSFRVKFLIVPNQTSLLCHFLLADPNIIVRSARHYICIIPRLHPISLHSEHSESLDKTTMVREQRIQIRGIKGRIQQRVTMTGIMVTQKWSAGKLWKPCV